MIQAATLLFGAAVFSFVIGAPTTALALFLGTVLLVGISASLQERAERSKK